MIRKALLPLVFLIAATAAAQSRGHAVMMPGPVSGNTVSGIVSAVNGTNVSLANGVVVLDVSKASITNDRGDSATITPGSLIFAVLQSNDSLAASKVIVSSVPQVTLSGPVQSVNAAAGTLQLLGLTVHTDAGTSFGGGHQVRGVADIAANDAVLVTANASGSVLVASSILVFPPMPQTTPTLLHGTVKSIGTDSWVIADQRRGDTTVAVNAQTKILGSPKVGDTVDVLANTDPANNFVAIAISISPAQLRNISGIVKSIAITSPPPGGSPHTFWVIGPAVGLGPDFQVEVTSDTKLVGNPKAGDHVDALVKQTSTGFVALIITRL